MPIRKYKPTSPARRSMSVSTFEEITKKRPEKALTEPLKKHAGRNNRGRITTRHRGGGHKRFYRIIDFKRNNRGSGSSRGDRIRSKPLGPNRSALLRRRRKALHPGATGCARRRHGSFRSRRADPNRECIAPGKHPDWYPDPQRRTLSRQGRAARSLGRCVGAVDGESRQVCAVAHAIRRSPPDPVDMHGNTRPGWQCRSREHRDRQGRTKPPKGWRPTVRGSVMNPNDHPHGGGEGKAPIGGQPKTKWGKPAFMATRNNKRTDSMIVRRRPKKRR